MSVLMRIMIAFTLSSAIEAGVSTMYLESLSYWQSTKDTDNLPFQLDLSVLEKILEYWL